VKVSFSDVEDANMSSLEHLSGGQKAVVAVSLLFAIQKISPAPFYIFDELDSPLDPTYRHALANLIKDFSQESQFLITTFKPDLVECADKIFEVS
jgi:structural maintenance of chromosome 3 (chondroitin sulfate proteoglycan 6)